MKIDRQSPRNPGKRVKHPTPKGSPPPNSAIAALKNRAPGIAIGLLICAFAVVVVLPRLRPDGARKTRAASAGDVAAVSHHPDRTSIVPQPKVDSVASGAQRLAPAAKSIRQNPVSAQLTVPDRTVDTSGQTPSIKQSNPKAVGLLRQVLAMVVHGPAFHAKVRETVWTNGRAVVGVGTYEQAGGSSGRFNLQVTMHDGDGKHRLQQISDGRLAWTRTEIAGGVSLRRVDVGRLDEWVRNSLGETELAPRLTVGAWAELLCNVERDYTLDVVAASLEEEAVWVLTGELRDDRRTRIHQANARKDKEWPMLYPTRIRIAVRAKSDPKTRIGELLPIRFEFWSDPIAASEDEDDPAAKNGRLITLIELYAIQPINPPSAERFRFENQDDEVNFTNETDRYIEQFGVQLTERELRQLRR